MKQYYYILTAKEICNWKDENLFESYHEALQAYKRYAATGAVLERATLDGAVRIIRSANTEYNYENQKH